MTERLLEINNLSIEFRSKTDIVPTIDEVSLYIDKGEILGLVGESGCGKTVTALSIMKLIPTPPARISKGEIFFMGENLLSKNRTQMQKIRGKDISMIFQEPMTSLNPVYTCGNQIAESIELHLGLSRKKAMAKAIDLLRSVEVPLPEKRVHEYPHQLSGGMQQRVMIAMALSCNPTLLIADEPTTALDVTIQAQILELLKKIQQEHSMAILFITHDLGVICEIADRVVVMYAGTVVEKATVYELFRNPLHPYTKGLLNSIPGLGTKKSKLYTIEGTVPNPSEMPAACRFYPRCTSKQDICCQDQPPLIKTKNGSKVACWLYNSEEVFVQTPGID
jgi:oligopeptide transport system ATP-binding protein